MALASSCLLPIALLLGLGCAPDAAEDGVASDAPAQDTERSRLAALEHEVELRGRRIHDELLALGDHPWAGSYYVGDGLGMNVGFGLAPQSGVVFTWHGCMGLYDANHGTAASDGDGRIRLEWENDPEEYVRFEPSALVVVPWGAEVFLVEPDDMAKFCRRVAAGGEPHHLRRRHGDEDERWRPPAGVPEVPEEYRHLLPALGPLPQ